VIEESVQLFDTGFAVRCNISDLQSTLLRHKSAYRTESETKRTEAAGQWLLVIVDGLDADNTDTPATLFTSLPATTSACTPCGSSGSVDSPSPADSEETITQICFQGGAGTTVVAG
jgi:hypothetical protein